MTSLLFTASLFLGLLLAPKTASTDGMRPVPGGEFLRGRTHKLPGAELQDGLKFFPAVLRDARPLRHLFLDPFHLDRHEVTNRQYADFLIATGRRAPHYWPDGKVAPGQQNQPVVNVTWEEAAAYCGWAGKRLPTEAEWERACRGGAESSDYPWGDHEPGKEDARFDTPDGPEEVCHFPPNAFDLCDMAGNVWEWTGDWYSREYYVRAPEKNPSGPSRGEYRVMRGGSWADAAKYLACGHRSFARPGERSPNIGFRCVRSP